MRIYFACPFSHLTAQKQTYLTFVGCIRDQGATLSRDWVETALSQIDQGTHPTQASLSQDVLRAIDTADGVIFDLSYPSTGLGQQIVYALLNKKPTLLLSDLSFSRPVREIFLLLRQAHNLTSIDYLHPDEACAGIRDFIDSIRTSLHRTTVYLDTLLYRNIQRAATHERVSINNILKKYINQYLSSRDK